MTPVQQTTVMGVMVLFIMRCVSSPRVCLALVVPLVPLDPVDPLEMLVVLVSPAQPVSE